MTGYLCLLPFVFTLLSFALAAKGQMLLGKGASPINDPIGNLVGGIFITCFYGLALVVSLMAWLVWSLFA